MTSYQDGATREDIERLPRYKFRRIGEVEKQSGEIQESYGGIMTECDTDSPIEHVLSLEDAVSLLSSCNNPLLVSSSFVCDLFILHHLSAYI